MPLPPHSAAVILAGGSSRRMGQDKAVLSADGRSLLLHSYDFWRQAGTQTVLLAVGTPEHLGTFPPLPPGLLPVFDRYPGKGPLAGLHGAFLSCKADVLYTSAIDMPGLSPALLPPENDGDASVFRVDGRIQPLFARYHRRVMPLLEELLQENRLRMTDLLDRIDTRYTDLSAAFSPVFRNLNTPEDLFSFFSGG